MAFYTSKGSVPHFTMRPHPLLTGTIVLNLIVGLLLSLSFFSKEDGAGLYQRRGILTLTITIVITLVLVILATSKMWFPHLWKKNSSHSRHKEHTRHHPSVREKQYRNKR